MYSSIGKLVSFNMSDNGYNISRHFRENPVSSLIYMASGVVTTIGLVFEHIAITKNEDATPNDKVAFYMLGAGLFGIIGNIGFIMKNEQLATEERVRAEDERVSARAERVRATTNDENIADVLLETHAMLKQNKEEKYIKTLEKNIDRNHRGGTHYEEFENMVQARPDSNDEYISQLNNFSDRYDTFKPGNVNIRDNLRSKGIIK